MLLTIAVLLEKVTTYSPCHIPGSRQEYEENIQQLRQERKVNKMLARDCAPFEMLPLFGAYIFP